MTQEIRMDNPLRQALKEGQSFWYDGLISNAEFERMIREDGLRGATTNPAIFEKALSGSEYDAEIKRFPKQANDEEIYKTLAVKAVQEVADAFLPVYQETSAKDGYVSIEVSPLLAANTDGTIREARELWRLVSRPNVMIKIPATLEGIPAIETILSEGIPVNVTLIFSVERYREVIYAFLRAFEKRAEAGLPLSGIASVASFFVSRVDTAVDKILDSKIASAESPAEKDKLKNLLGKAAIANSKAAYEEFKAIFSSARFAKLESRGAQVQRPLWASTGTKNPAYRDVLYVETLIGPDTVNTMPPPTMAAFRDHGIVAPTLEKEVPQALQALKELKSIGIDLDRIVLDLEKAGVELFCDAYRKIIQGIGEKRK